LRADHKDPLVCSAAAAVTVQPQNVVALYRLVCLLTTCSVLSRCCCNCCWPPQDAAGCAARGPAAQQRHWSHQHGEEGAVLVLVLVLLQQLGSFWILPLHTFLQPMCCAWLPCLGCVQRSCCVFASLVNAVRCPCVMQHRADAASLLFLLCCAAGSRADAAV
jgi:hypothetical protein